LILDNKYQYIKQLGVGGFGTVFLAEDILSRRKVAIKRLKSNNKQYTKQFLKEIETISKFEHPNIVKYYHYFIDKKILHLVMEYCEGGTLNDRIRNKNYTIEEGVKWAKKLAGALRIVNKNGIIHRDIRPVNILFDKNGEIKLSDFGIANGIHGVPAYFCPDNTWLFENDPRIDIYALGVTLIEILTFQNPFFFKNSTQIKELHKTKNFGINLLPNWIQKIIEKAIAFDKFQRFQYMVQFEEALRSQNIPVSFDKKFILSSKEIEEGLKLLKLNKREKAKIKIELGLSLMENNLIGQKALGLLYLNNNKIDEAKKQIEKTLAINPRINLHFELGWLYLELKKYNKAISIISDYITRNPLDAQAYPLLLRSYLETNRFEAAFELTKCIENSINIPSEIILNTILICSYKLGFKFQISNTELNHPFIKFNIDLIDYLQNNPNNKSYYNFLHIDNQVINFENNKLVILFKNEKYTVLDNIIVFELDKENKLTFNTRNYESMDLFIIANFKNNIWLYPFNSTQIYIDGAYIQHKVLIEHTVEIKFAMHKFQILIDEWKLF
jgi:serine/threonine protein kinase